MMMRLVLAAVLMSLPCSASAQAIRGRVLEEAFEVPITGVAVDALDRAGIVLATSATDTLGEFLLRLNAPGRVTLRLTHPSFKLASGVTDVTVAADETITVELQMTPASIQLRPIAVASPRDRRLVGFYDRIKRPGSGQFITRADIERRPGARTTDLLRELRGVEILPVGTGAGRPRVQLIALRGGRARCSPTVYVDGIVVAQYAESGVDDFLRPEMLEGAEVYTSSSSAPPPINSRDSCGVVAFWTRPVEDVEKWSWKRIIAGAAALGGLGLLVLISR